jgi:hypothetical protein
LADYFSGFPLIQFKLGEEAFYQWFPAQYLIEHNDHYCFAAESVPFRPQQQLRITFGTSVLRQHLIFFGPDEIGFWPTVYECSADLYATIFNPFVATEEEQCQHNFIGDLRSHKL